jgi:hypothetical protein
MMHALAMFGLGIGVWRQWTMTRHWALAKVNA